MTRCAVTVPRPVCTTAWWSFCSMRCTGAASATTSPSCRASPSGTSCEPPTKRRSWAPPAVSELREKVPDVLLVARARDVPEHVEEGELAGVGAEARLGPAADEVLDAARR